MEQLYVLRGGRTVPVTITSVIWVRGEAPLIKYALAPAQEPAVRCELAQAGDGLNGILPWKVQFRVTNEWVTRCSVSVPDIALALGGHYSLLDRGIGWRVVGPDGYVKEFRAGDVRPDLWAEVKEGKYGGS